MCCGDCFLKHGLDSMVCQFFREDLSPDQCTDNGSLDLFLIHRLVQPSFFLGKGSKRGEVKNCLPTTAVRSSIQRGSEVWRFP